jgi:hypothetical protein
MYYIIDEINELNDEFKALKKQYNEKSYEMAGIYQTMILHSDAEKDDLNIQYMELEEESNILLLEMSQIIDKEKDILKDASIFLKLTLPVALYDEHKGYIIDKNSIKIKDLLKCEELKENFDFECKVNKILEENDELDLENIKAEGEWIDDEFYCNYLMCYKNDTDFISIDFNNGFVYTFKDDDGVKKQDKYTNLDLQVINDCER